VTAINGHIRAGATAVIVLGVSNQTESKYIMERKYQELRERLHALPDYQTIDGFYEFAKVDAEGTITLTDAGGSQWEIS
jgi:hypothetical protein